MFVKEVQNYFRGNPNLRRSDQPVEWTPERMIEWEKCKHDPIYFGENYFTIITSNGKEKIPFRDYQRELVISCKDHKHTIAEMSRQSGKTTAVTVFALWYIIFHPDKTIALLANKAETAREILGRIQMAFEQLPEFLQRGVKEWNKGSFVLENDSRILAAATSSDNIRGYTIDILIIDEAAHIDNWNEFFTSVYPTVSSRDGYRVILISTVYGLNHFYDIAEKAKKGQNNYNIISVPWQRVPGRDEEWKKMILAGMNHDYEKFEQEYSNEYLGSSGTLIAGWKLKELKMDVEEPILRNAGIYQYEKPRIGRKYTLVADTSRGKGLDYSAFQIIDTTELPYNQVCIFRDNLVAPIDYAEIVHRMAKTYNDAICLIENNDIGAQVADIIYEDYEYEGVLQTESAGREGKRISGGFGTGKAEKGIRTTKTVKSVGCSMIKMILEQDKMRLHDKATIDEINTFSKKANSYEAESGKTDDLIMCLVLFGWLTNQPYFKDYSDINTLANLREKDEEEIMADLLPFGVIDDHNIPDDLPVNDDIFDHYSLDPFDRDDYNGF